MGRKPVPARLVFQGPGRHDRPRRGGRVKALSTGIRQAGLRQRGFSCLWVFIHPDDSKTFEHPWLGTVTIMISQPREAGNAKAAKERTESELYGLSCGHFDVYVPPLFQQTVGIQIRFLKHMVFRRLIRSVVTQMAGINHFAASYGGSQPVQPIRDKTGDFHVKQVRSRIRAVWFPKI